MITKIERKDNSYVVKYRKWYQFKWQYAPRILPNLLNARAYAYTIEHNGAK